MKTILTISLFFISANLFGDETPAFIEEGKAYLLSGFGAFAHKILKIDEKNDNWVLTIDEDGDKNWINLNMLAHAATCEEILTRSSGFEYKKYQRKCRTVLETN